MKLLDSKTKRQNEGGLKWRDSKGRGILDYYMGFGKTYSAILIIKNVLAKKPDATVVIVAPSENLVKQWTNVLKQHFTRNELNLIIVYSSNYVALNNFYVPCYLCIIDEIHEFYTDDKIRIVDGTLIHYKFILALTGTLKDKENRYKRVLEFLPVVDRITQADCEANGWTSDFIEYNLNCTLTKAESEVYIHHSETIKTLMPLFGKAGLWLVQRCLVGGKDDKDVVYSNFAYANGWAHRMGWHANLDLQNSEELEIYQKWKPSTIIGYARKVMEAIRLRKNLLYNAKNKIETVKALIEKYPTLTTIIFSQTTQMADVIGNIIPDCTIYHSKIQTKILPIGKNGKEIKVGQKRLKDMAEHAIRTGLAKRISTVASMNRGTDIPNLNMSIVTADVSNHVTYDQRRTRSTRLNLDKIDEQVLLINLYIAGTKRVPSVDEKWLKKRQSKATHDIIWVDSIEEIDYVPYDNKPREIPSGD